jgi:murein DD-endopeptidase MepM/ murein hydrolase activator NlpD
MTAPQHTTKENTNAKEGGGSSHHSSSHHNLQRCWFVTLGLVGGLGFVASQVSLARAEGDFLIDGYAASASTPTPEADQTVTGYSAPGVAETTFSPSSAPSSTISSTNSAPNFEMAPALQPLPEAFPDAFIDAPSTPSVAAEAFSIEAASAYVPAPIAEAPAAPVAPLPPVTVPVAPTPSPAVAAAPTPSITIEIQPSRTANPQVSQVAPPTFVSVRKPVATKAARRNNPWLGLIEARALAGPLSAYINHAQAASVSGAVSASQNVLGQSVLGQSAASLNSSSTKNRATLVAMDTSADGGAFEAEPAATSDAPNIYPEAAPPPIVDIEPAAQSADPIQPSEIVPATLPESANIPEEYNSVFVDPTDYSVGATQAPDVFVSEQSTGCEFTVGGGQAVPNGACGTSGSSSAGSAPAPQAAPAQDYAQDAPAYAEQAPVASSSPSVNVGPVSFDASGIRFSSSTTAAGREYLNRAVRPLVNLQAAEQFIFPLAIPSPITSLFGFRIHPISGDQRFHAGTDIGAEQGTPVLAAQDGTVESADYAGGYGLMVVLNHQVKDTELQSRYAHLSDVMVEPGKSVKKGDVIGLVGSTGNSTGPHLHFEMLQNTADGWVLVNPDSLIQTSLAKLVDALNNPLQAANFKLSDFNLNLSALRTTPRPSQPGSSVTLPTLPGQNGVSFRPAQPNAS